MTLHDLIGGPDILKSIAVVNKRDDMRFIDAPTRHGNEIELSEFLVKEGITEVACVTGYPDHIFMYG